MVGHVVGHVISPFIICANKPFKNLKMQEHITNPHMQYENFVKTTVSNTK